MTFRGNGVVSMRFVGFAYGNDAQEVRNQRRRLVSYGCEPIYHGLGNLNELRAAISALGPSDSLVIGSRSSFEATKGNARCLGLVLNALRDEIGAVPEVIYLDEE